MQLEIKQRGGAGGAFGFGRRQVAGLLHVHTDRLETAELASDCSCPSELEDIGNVSTLNNKVLSTTTLIALPNVISNLVNYKAESKTHLKQHNSIHYANLFAFRPSNTHGCCHNTVGEGVASQLDVKQQLRSPRE